MGNFVKLLQTETIISLGIANAPTADLLENSRGGDQSHEKRISYIIARDWQLKIIIAKCDGNITTCNSLVYYKVLWTDIPFLTKCDKVYYKVRQVLQSAIELLQIARRALRRWSIY